MARDVICKSTFNSDEMCGWNSCYVRYIEYLISLRDKDRDELMGTVYDV